MSDILSGSDGHGTEKTNNGGNSRRSIVEMKHYDENPDMGIWWKGVGRGYYTKAQTCICGNITGIYKDGVPVCIECFN